MITTIKIATSLSPPYVFLNSEKQIDGLDYEIIKKSFEIAGYNVEIILMENWSTINFLVENGELDGAYHAQETPQEFQGCLFSNPLRISTIELLTAREELSQESYVEIATDDLIIGLLRCDCNRECLESFSSMNKKVYDNQEILIKDIYDKKVDLGFVDTGILPYSTNKSGYKFFNISEFNFNKSINVVFNKRNSIIRDDFNYGLKKLIETNQYFEITKYWKSKQEYINKFKVVNNNECSLEIEVCHES